MNCSETMKMEGVARMDASIRVQPRDSTGRNPFSYSTIFHCRKQTFPLSPPRHLGASQSMATSTSHQAFPSRPYTSALGGGRATGGTTPYNTTTPFNVPQTNPGGYGAGASGATSTQQQREAQRLERERQERAERERREAEERGALESLSEEQREEINEAVCPCP